MTAHKTTKPYAAKTKPTTHNPHEQLCIDTAVSYSAVRGAGGTRTRVDFDALDHAIAYAKTFSDKRTMIYAISHTGSAAHMMNI